MEVLKPVLHQSGYPDQSAGFAPVLLRAYNAETRTAPESSIRLSYSVVKIERLPPPYPTNCKQSINDRDLQRSASYTCTAECFEQSTQRLLGKQPFSHINVEPLPIRLVSAHDINNMTFRKILMKVRDNCSRVCMTQPDCVEEYTITWPTVERGDDSDIFFSVDIPHEPSIFIVFKAKLPLVEFMVLSLSCFSTWWGFSVLGLNPFTPARIARICRRCKTMKLKHEGLVLSHNSLKHSVTVLTRRVLDE